THPFSHSPAFPCPPFSFSPLPTYLSSLQMIYFDHNATAPVLREAREAWLEATERIHGNPSSPHAFGVAANKAMTDAREKLAHHLGCHPADLVWTSGATEANNMCLHHFA